MKLANVTTFFLNPKIEITNLTPTLAIFALGFLFIDSM
ncbi:hypothetical protein SPONN_1292 [uncultured Candidatus Thioglobus sp.]|nr:hypothetical protein SPONN_1292 [uncultured Candidatus Thioglobus sp.]